MILEAILYIVFRGDQTSRLGPTGVIARLIIASLGSLINDEGEGEQWNES